jgi:general nucleoside transport system ATP-binding protein
LSALELRGIAKRFGAVAAVDGVTLSVEPGEVLALVGENGAGKSTLVGVASGLYRPDAGSVHVGDRALAAGDPRAAMEAGLGVVFQQSMLVPPLRVWENVVLGREPRRFGLIDSTRARREVAAVARQARLEVDVDAPVETLGAAAQQRVEIVKQLWRGARVLILDEPTALLAPAEVDALLGTVRSLAGAGRGVVFISHKLREVFAIADRVAVLRRGKLVQVVRTRETSAAKLAEAVMGASPTGLATDLAREAASGLGLTEDEIGASAPPAPAALSAPSARAAIPAPSNGETPGRPAERVLVASDLRCEDDRGRAALKGLCFRVGAGEILGVAGVDGNGQRELAEVLTGLRRARGSLTFFGVEGLGRNGWARNARGARRIGIVHLPEDRAGRALCLPMTMEENVALGREMDAPYARGPLIDVNGRRAKAEELIAALDIRPRDPLARAGALSGGNQQKLVAARELWGGPAPRLVVAVQPTRGLDVGAAHRVHGALRTARNRGAAVVLVSFDLDELRALSDRILVLYDGAAAGEASPDAGNDLLGRLMLGEAA